MKKKVVITAAQVPFVSGGAELMVESLRVNLIKRGYEAEVVMLPFKWYPEESLYDSMLAWKMLDLEEANGSKIDLVIGTKFPSYGVNHSNKVVWLMHQFRQVYDLYENEFGYSDFPNGATIKHHIEEFDKKALSGTKGLYSISENVSKRLRQFNGLEAEPLYQPPSLIGRYISAKPDNYVLSVGRLDKLKRNELLIESLVHCDKTIRAKIAGRGPEMDNLKALAENLGVSDRVDFLGFVQDEDLLKLYSEALAVFFAPVDEDYGFITLEAFLSQRPVITSIDSGGVLEFVEDSKSGYVCDIDPRQMGECIGKLAGNKNTAMDFGRCGYEKVKDISWDNVIDRLTESIR